MSKLNNILQLKGRFEKRKNDSGFGPMKLPANQKVSSQHVLELKKQLENIREYWIRNRDIEGALVSVHYTRVVAKSNRLRNLLGDTGKKPVDSICGAKFVTEKDTFGRMNHKHVFTHYVQLSALEKAILNLEIVADIINLEYKGVITSKDTENIGKDKKYKYDKMNTNLKKQKEGYYEQASKQEKEKNSDVETYAIQFFIDHCIRSLCVFCLSVGNNLLWCI